MRHTKLEPYTNRQGEMENIVPRESDEYAFVDTPVGRLVVNVCAGRRVGHSHAAEPRARSVAVARSRLFARTELRRRGSPNAWGATAMHCCGGKPSRPRAGRGGVRVRPSRTPKKLKDDKKLAGGPERPHYSTVHLTQQHSARLLDGTEAPLLAILFRLGR